MKASYAIDRTALDNMEVTLEISMSLNEWAKLARILNDGKWHADGEQFASMINRMHDTYMDATVGRYVSTAYRTDHDSEPNP